jgi:hypothetical protein
MSSVNRLLSAVVVAGAVSSALHASTTITTTLGFQHFKDGDKPTTSTYNTATAGNPTPFIGFNSSSDTSTDFDASWTISYSLPAGSVTAGTLTIGIYDHDSAAAGDQVALFTLGGVDLTTDLNTALEGHGGANREYDIYSLTLPSSTFATLHTGSASFHLTLQGPGLGVLGTTTFNGAGVDFVTLGVTVPEPQNAAFAFGAAALLFVGIRRCRR